MSPKPDAVTDRFFYRWLHLEYVGLILGAMLGLRALEVKDLSATHPK